MEMEGEHMEGGGIDKEEDERHGGDRKGSKGCEGK